MEQRVSHVLVGPAGAALVAFLLLAADTRPATAQCPQHYHRQQTCRSTEVADSRPRSGHAPEVWAHVDPGTGELGPAPEIGGAEQPGPPGSGDRPDIEILPGRSPAGGVMVDLRGRFALGMRASLQDGRVTARCEPRKDEAVAE